MNHIVATHQLREMSDIARVGMFRLRYDTFFTRLRWDVQTHDGLESDEFDSIDSARYIVATSARE